LKKKNATSANVRSITLGRRTNVDKRTIDNDNSYAYSSFLRFVYIVFQ